MHGLIVRFGPRWKGASVAWARRTMRYAGAFKPLLCTRELDVWARGSRFCWRISDSEMLYALPSEGVEDLSTDYIFRDGEFLSDVDLRFGRHLFISVNHNSGRFQLVVGRFLSLGCYYAQSADSLLLLPELKAFSSLGRGTDVKKVPLGSKLKIDLKAGDFTIECSSTELLGPERQCSYPDAVKMCRTLLERALDRELEGVDGPVALALSGGVDSSILAAMLRNRGLTVPAFIAWFDFGKGDVSPDLKYARQAAAVLEMELNEVRIRPSDMESLLLDSIYVGERSSPQLIDNGLYYLPLLQAMKDRGFEACFRADGIDTLFWGFDSAGEQLLNPSYRDTYLMYLTDGHARHVPACDAYTGVRSIQPFTASDIYEFALSLPQDYCVGRAEWGPIGKRIVRDAFRGELPSEFLDQRKRTPGMGNFAPKLTSQLLGGRRAKGKAYTRIKKRLFEPPPLEYVPSVLVDSGLLDFLVTIRRRRARATLRRYFARGKQTGRKQKGSSSEGKNATAS